MSTQTAYKPHKCNAKSILKRRIDENKALAADRRKERQEGRGHGFTPYFMTVKEGR